MDTRERRQPGGVGERETSRDALGSPPPDAVHPAIAQAHAATERARSLQRTVGDLADSTPTPEERASRVVDAAMRQLGATAAVSARLLDDGAVLELDGALAIPDDLFEAHRRLPVNAPFPLCAAARLGHGIFCGTRADALREYPALAPMLERLGAHALCAVPVRHLGRVVGALGLYFPAPRGFDPTERTQLRVFGDRYARGLHEARLYFAERRARAEADRLRAEADAARREAEAAREEAVAANRAKTRALQVVTHDLRNPLQAVLGYAELIADGVSGPVTEEQRRSLARITAAGKHLLDLIDDLFSAALIESNVEQVDVERFPVHVLCEEVTGIAEPLAHRKGLAFRCTLSDDVTVMELVSDRRKLRQVLVNLVVNAIKFTPAGAVAVTVDLGRHRSTSPECEELVTFDVTDTGVGIAPEHLEHIFDPFWQVPGGGAPGGIERRQELEPGVAARPTGGPERLDWGFRRGAGLGLSIARRYVELLGGTIAVASRVGEGSTFTVHVPRRRP